MNIGLYYHSFHNLTELLARELKQRGVNVYKHECLCEEDSLESNLEDIAVIHPADDNSGHCWDKIKNAIIKHEGMHFYIFAYGKKERIEGIGPHPNLKYITERNAANMLSEIIKKAQS